ncbi:MAG: hypothetical protein A3F84_22235 [Candidatus Handelsmanbacteria bacterium RIFCSPLOWO2_12_FULL_64_10]|uniref:Uncharacterized protein n=1 Tax=Handelsmanbacteria sp. (strain RIFCSPLOWO2_12_FULL_64_10) TaxID=1817868 RepID=A0A1F6D4I8_HANXR|nr:MAG: hypothetical protein A3F84_22235 [Candidatus Handelsmanbacteria bacterium RIFCSPLOWO2_12_FULL_64_10]
MNTTALVFENQTASGGRVRIWRYTDGRFLLEYIKPDGKATMVFCPTFEEALSLWCHLENGGRPSLPDGPENLKDGG